MPSVMPGFTAAWAIGPARSSYARAAKRMIAAGTVHPTDGGSCDCSGAPGPCSLDKNQCAPGWRPDCSWSPFGCTCECKR